MAHSASSPSPDD